MATMPGRGAPMPYEVLAGVEPCEGGWLVMAGKLHGTNLGVEPPQVFASFSEVIDWKPAFQTIAVHAPLGLATDPTRGGRTCDRAARKLLGRHHWLAVTTPPTRHAMVAETFEAAVAVDGVLRRSVWQYVPRFREVAAEMAPYWQRTIFEVNPELSFFSLNGEAPLRHGRHTRRGFSERCSLLDAALPGVDRVIAGRSPDGATAHQVLDACASLWTARRIRAHAAVRMPVDPDWDDRGIRMEIWR